VKVTEGHPDMRRLARPMSMMVAECWEFRFKASVRLSAHHGYLLQASTAAAA